MSNSSNPDVEDIPSLLINPNLGHPLFLNTSPKLKNTNFEAKLLFVSNIEDLKEFRTSIKHDLQLIPIIDYKWKLTSLLGKSKEDEKKGFWARRKEKKAKNKRLKKGLPPKRYGDKRLSKLKPRAVRGDPIIPSVYDIEISSSLPINNPQYINEEYSHPQSYLFKYNVFNNRVHYYSVTIEFDLTEEVIDFLKRRNFVMFDIHQGKNRINYHSIVVTKNKGKNLTFVQATDLHLAERNDKIYGIIKKWTKTVKKEELEKNLQKFIKKINIFQKKNPDNEKPTDKPLIKRLINPNNQFRKFIRLMNKKVLQNELDFIVITGDIIDFTLKSKLTRKIIKTADFSYENSNWPIFKDIITNYRFSQKPNDIAISKGEELLCPIFTVLGNHDFRVAAYDLTWGGIYKKMGLNSFEAIALNERFLASPIDSITKSYAALKGYWSEISPSLDFTLELGNNIFIFLNSGPDSFKNIRDLLAGHPSVTGLTSRQIEYLENIINSKYNKKENIFLFLHGPPINTGGRRSILKRLSKKLGKKDLFVKIGDFKESLIRKIENSNLKARIDGKFNVKYGTISTNWEKLVEFCKDYCVLTLAGHTHKLNEYRLENPIGKKTTVFNAPPFSLKKIENPAAIYHDLYSESYTKSKGIKENGPFVVQTPALGLGSFGDLKGAGAYREVIIKGGKLASFRIKYLNR